MSCFATPAQSISQSVRACDDRVHVTSYVWADWSRTVGVSPWIAGTLWSASRFCGCGLGSDGQLADGAAARWYVETLPSGTQTAKVIVGQTKDSGGSPLGNCIVQGFLTAGDVYVGEVTSDTGGYYRLPTPYTDAHYLVAYKAGSPDVAGTTVNTLVGV
jgi:hypothetical protein